MSPKIVQHIVQTRNILRKKRFLLNFPVTLYIQDTLPFKLPGCKFLSTLLKKSVKFNIYFFVCVKSATEKSPAENDFLAILCSKNTLVWDQTNRDFPPLHNHVDVVSKLYDTLKKSPEG